MNKKKIFIKLVLTSLLPLALFGCVASSNVQIPEKSYSATNEYMELAISEARKGIYNGDGGRLYTTG